MLPYQDETRELEELLERLFDESTPDDVMVFRKPSLPGICTCCTYSYGGS